MSEVLGEGEVVAGITPAAECSVVSAAHAAVDIPVYDDPEGMESLGDVECGDPAIGYSGRAMELMGKNLSAMNDLAPVGDEVDDEEMEADPDDDESDFEEVDEEDEDLDEEVDFDDDDEDDDGEPEERILG